MKAIKPWFIGFAAACLACIIYCGCKSAASTALTADSVVIVSVDQAMQKWAAYTQSGKGTDSQILTVSNLYTIYYQGQMIVSNTFAYYAQNPTTANQSILTQAVLTEGINQTNLINLIATLTK